MKINKKIEKSWLNFISNQQNQGHLQRSILNNNLELHINACRTSAKNTVLRISEDLPEFRPKKIIEVGSSTGLNCFALAEYYTQSEVIGIEPEKVAVMAAKSMLQDRDRSRISFEVGIGEKLPFDNNTVDLIVCHTVIEHVENVEEVISEMARVLRKNGKIHLDAPNYIFPYEPHLRIFTLPKLGKKFVALSAYFQGKGKYTPFLKHLQFVTPAYLENLFVINGLSFQNRAVGKLKSSLTNINGIKKYRKIAICLQLLNKIGLGNAAIFLIALLRLYPSLMYTASLKRQ